MHTKELEVLNDKYHKQKIIQDSNLLQCEIKDIIIESEQKVFF